MAAIQAMLPAALASVAEELQPRDELLTADELQIFSLFESLKKAPSFARFPGTTVLRRCEKGRVICSQGDAGATAFYILTTEDVLALREVQLESLETTIRGKAEEQPEDDLHQYYGKRSLRELGQLQTEMRDEVLSLRERLEQIRASDDQSADAIRMVASANLLVNLEDEHAQRGLLHRLVSALSGRRGGRATRRPSYIPNDGPTDINAETLTAPLHEGELLGEMSCMNRAPRSATVIVEQDCYLLEMLRNVLDMLHSDPAYKQRMDETYRSRVLETHVRRLSVFEELDDTRFAQLQDAFQLEEFESGSVIFEEHDASDCFYVIRSGLVKVVANCWTALRASEFKKDHWNSLPEELADDTDESAALRAYVWNALPVELQETVESATAPDESGRHAMLEALNAFIRKGQVHTQLGKTSHQVVDAVDSVEIQTAVADFSEDTKRWSELDVRTFHRLFLEHVCPQGIPRRVASSGPPRTLAYLGRGDTIGEIGVLLNEPRSATCVAYDHPVSGHYMRIPDDRTGAVPSRVEFVRIDKNDFQKLIVAAPSMRVRIEEIIEQRKRRSATDRRQNIEKVPTASAQTPEFDQLGLIQGQDLMLIDLDRCTRCNACVEACITAHDDGRTRLYLDGPRFDKYLVPLTCRECVDPVCMIGCPVGAINRGDNGEILIRNWCIGCRVCAEQCPYGAIQMSELLKPVKLTADEQAILHPGASIKAVQERAIVCDLCSSLPSQDPACVYSCPHDATFRINSNDFFFETIGPVS